MARKTEAVPAPERARPELVGVVLFVAGLFILASLILSQQQGAAAAYVPALVARGLRTLFGSGAYLVGLALVTVGALALCGASGAYNARVAGAVGLFFLCFLVARHMGVPRGAEFDGEALLRGGGVVGAGAWWAAQRTLGHVCAWIVMAGLLLAASVLFTQAHSLGLAGALSRGAGASSRWIAGQVARAAQRPKAPPPRSKAKPAAAEEAPAAKPSGSYIITIGDGDEPAPLDGAAPPEGGSEAESTVAERPADLSEAPPLPEPLPLPTFRLRDPAEPAPLPPIPARGAKAKPEQLPLLEGKDLYQPPPMSLITRFDADDPTAEDREQAEARKALLEDVLSSFGIQAKVHTYVRGPAVTRYEVEPVRGIRVSRIAGLAQDLAVAFGASPVRVEPIPNKPLIGIEVPNGEISTVGLRAILESDACRKNRSLLAVGIGKDISGTPIIADLGRMPHLLIAGATNAGKTICLHSIITSLLMRARPDQVRLIMIDPKRVELMLYDGIPHLLAPIVQTAPLAADLLRKVIREMEHRFDQFAMKGVVNITEYNELAAKPKDDDYEDEFEPLPYVVVVVDELADLMMQARAEFEFSICRLAQMARATGIHLVIATQRPSVNVLTGTIKANIPSRIALSTVNHHDSRTIIDQQGAERLLGRGDMLYHPADANQGRRVQGAFISRHDLELIVDHLRDQGEPEYQIIPEVSEELGGYGDESEPSDELYEKAVELVASAQEASVSMLQRRFKIGYARAGRLVDMMEERGVVGPSEGSKARKVLVPPGYRSRAASFPPDEPVTYDDLEDEVLDAPDEEDGVLVSHDGETP